MPWKGELSNVPNNIETAKKRLTCTEKSIRKRGLGDSYKTIIEQYLEKGYIRKVAKDDKSGRWYLPHFAISRPDKSTTKTRIVFDASARHDGVCLNDFIHKGPKLQRDLVDVLLRFRRAPVAIVCDVAEMYLQIEIREEDRLFHRFLWRDMQDREADVIQAFGIWRQLLPVSSSTRYAETCRNEQITVSSSFRISPPFDVHGRYSRFDCRC